MIQHAFPKFSPKILKFLFLKETWLNSGIYLFYIFHGQVCWLIAILKRLLVKLGFSLLIVLGNSIQSAFNLLIFTIEVAGSSFLICIMFAKIVYLHSRTFESFGSWKLLLKRSFNTFHQEKSLALDLRTINQVIPKR